MGEMPQDKAVERQRHRPAKEFGLCFKCKEKGIEGFLKQWVI